MKHHHLSCLYVLIALLMAGCHSTDRHRLEQALVLAGSNRAELEKVLDHYSRDEADSLKLRAARFLISNMPGHCSYTGEAIEEYYRKATPILQSGRSRSQKEKQLNELFKQYPEDSIETVEDVQVVTADYLISNIEAAFADWQEGLWACTLTFDEFCEYLLPYKCADYQTLDRWRDSLRGLAADKMKYYPYNQINRNSAYYAVRAINTKLGEVMDVKVSTRLNHYPFYRVPLWTQLPSGTCGAYSTIAVAAMRSAGVPVAHDFILHWASGYSDHSWVTVFMESGVRGYCEGSHGGVFGQVRPGEYKGKVYRHTYAANEDLVALNQEAEYVPSQLRTWFMKDVTREYITPSQFTLAPLESKYDRNQRYAYVAVFGDRDWTIIGFSKIKDDRITFDNLERNVVYLPCYYTATGIEAVNYPVLIDKQGKTCVLRPDTAHRREVTLKRKYFVSRAAYERGLLLQGGMLQASHKADFSEAVTLHTFDTFTLAGAVGVNDTTAYRYWRYYHPGETHCNMAEIGFYDTAGKPVSGTIIGSKEKDAKRHTKKAVFDRKPLSYFESEQKAGAWVGMDFGKPVALSKIDYLIRSDGNNIWIGDVYELFYWGAQGWVSLGKQKAAEMQVTFSGVPDNALLLLRDLTEGKDERIFLYRDGEQVWY